MYFCAVYDYVEKQNLARAIIVHKKIAFSEMIALRFGKKMLIVCNLKVFFRVTVL